VVIETAFRWAGVRHLHAMTTSMANSAQDEVDSYQKRNMAVEGVPQMRLGSRSAGRSRHTQPGVIDHKERFGAVRDIDPSAVGKILSMRRIGAQSLDVATKGIGA
jgi:hypothetical protein